VVPGTQPVQKYFILSEGPERADPKYGAVRDCLILVPRENTRNPKHLFKRVFLSEAGKHCRLCRTSTKNPKRAPAVRVPRAEENFVQRGIKSKEGRNQAVKTRSDWVFKALLLFVGSGLWALAVSHGIGRVDAEAESETQPAPNVIQTQRLEIVDKTGRVTATLAPTVEGGGGIMLFNPQGKPGIILGASTHGPGLIISDPQGKLGATFIVTTEGPVLSLFDTQGKSGVTLGVSEDVPCLILSDTQGKIRIGLSALKECPMLSLFDTQGKARISLDVSGDSPRLSILDTRGKTRAVLGVTTTVNKVTGAETTTSEGTLTLFNEEGTVLFQEP
jgi:hypothetical protein